MKTFRSQAPALAALILTVLLAGCGAGTTPSPGPSPVPASSTPDTSHNGEINDASGDVKITSVKLNPTGEFGSGPSLDVAYTVHNPTDHVVSYNSIEFEYLDKTGNRVGEDTDSVDLLAPGQSAHQTLTFGGFEPGDTHGAVAVKVIAVYRLG
jgi:hypothetical protein